MITILCGKSGSGKDTLLSHLVDTGLYQPLGSERADDYAVKKKELVTILDMKGAQDYITAYGRENCFVVMLELADDIRKERAMKRGSFDETEWNRRLEDDAVKFSDEATENIVNFRLKNDTDIEELGYRLDDALVAYEQYIDSKAVKQEQITEQLICYEDYTFYHIDEEPSITYKVMPKGAYDAMIEYEEQALQSFQTGKKGKHNIER